MRSFRRVFAAVMAVCMAVGLTACGGQEEISSGVEDGVLTIAMECAYAPYNWTQYDDSNGAVAISGADGEYANGYDVMIAKMICEANNWQLEIIRTDWDSLVPGIQSGTYDAVIAGQSMTKTRSQQVDFAGFLCLDSLPYKEGQPLCIGKGHIRSFGRPLHGTDRHHLV